MTSRRVFLKNGAVALLSLGFAPSFLARTVSAARARRKVLVAIFQRGAVDGLNLVVPAGEQAYYDARPTIAIPRPGGGQDAAIDLDGFFALHPRLAPLKPIYDARHLAFVHAVGSPDNTRSHFDAQDYMETATPGVKSTTDGGLNRYLQAQKAPDATPFRGVALTPQMPRALGGKAPALALGQLNQFGVRAGRAGAGLEQAFEAEYQGAADALLGTTASEAFDAIRMLKAADLQQYRPASGADYPSSPFGEALKQIAQLVKADVGLEVAFADVGGWDTHVNQGAATGQLAGRLDDVARGLAALFADLGERMDDVVVLTMSEFGRTIGENGNRGTDHGHGNAMIVMGGPVRGGKVYGRWPGLVPEQRYEGRDLAVTTDFRDVFGEIVVRHLGVADASPIFPGYMVRAGNFRGLVG
jgi:uncharacterized protein (DUF1501 family)